MKIRGKHYVRLRTAILGVHHLEIWEAYKQRGLTPNRYRWDCIWASKFDLGALYRDLNVNDNHIETALRHILPLD